MTQGYTVPISSLYSLELESDSAICQLCGLGKITWPLWASDSSIHEMRVIILTLQACGEVGGNVCSLVVPHTRCVTLRSLASPACRLPSTTNKHTPYRAAARLGVITILPQGLVMASTLAMSAIIVIKRIIPCPGPRRCSIHGGYWYYSFPSST